MPTWNYTGAVQTWTVPKTGRYRVVAMGAGGGIGTQNSEGVYSLGGKGSEVTGDIYLKAGQELKIVVGAKGNNAKNSYFEWHPDGTRGVDKTSGGHGGIAGVFDASTGFPLLIARGGNGGYDSCFLTTRNLVHRKHGEDGSIESLLSQHPYYHRNYFTLAYFDKVLPRLQREHPEDKNIVYSVDPVYGAGAFSHDDSPPSGSLVSAFTVNFQGFISSRQGVNSGNATLSIEFVDEGKVIAPSTDLRVMTVTTTFAKPNDSSNSVGLINPILNRELRKDEKVGIKLRIVYKNTIGAQSTADTEQYYFIKPDGISTYITIVNPTGPTLNHQNADVKVQLLVFNPAGVTEIPMQSVLANPPEKPVFKEIPTKVKVGEMFKVEWAPVSAPTQIYYTVDFSKDGTNFTELAGAYQSNVYYGRMTEEFISTKAVYRVRAYVKAKASDEYAGIASDYSLSNPFTIEKNVPPDYPIEVSPAGTLESPSIITTQNPTITWKYTDPNKEDIQSAYRVLIKKALDDSVVHDTEKVNSSQSTFTLPSGIIEKNTFYYHQIHTLDSSGLENENIQRQYFLMNKPPSGLIIIGPEDTRRTSNRPSFEAVIGNDLEKDNQHFMIQLAEDADFTKNVQTFRSNKDIQGWEAKLLNEDYQAITDEGVTSSYEGGSVRYTMQTDLQEGLTYFWRMAPVDATTGAQGVWSTARSIKVGNVLQFQLKKPITTSLAAERMVFRAKVKLPTDGKLPASLKMEACNNALDEEPAWEDITEAYTQGKYHAFKNKTKSADSWALDVRVTINANDSLGEIECDGFGLSFD
ncbi:glycine-rich protein [Brevibacillus laterosporus]|uniref:receptor protein-tyrosine kinase n=1 Tax=Brevibacillus halotolerans TaxID=1507437 RepID=A0ABT4HYI9_9BACL|nr:MULTISPECIES: glycine-rich protein [Brevibacillus]MCR8985715.1 glycine-rich protein [Brevibacillus laterosporus]MCZ0831449.1 glycine-rich protein [Brevibacillus halotolerans]